MPCFPQLPCYSLSCLVSLTLPFTAVICLALLCAACMFLLSLPLPNFTSFHGFFFALRCAALPCLALRCFTLPCPLLPLHYSDLPCLTIPSLALRCPALKRHAIKYRISRNVYLHHVLVRKIRFCVRYPYVLNETKAFLLLLERTNYHLKSKL